MASNPDFYGILRVGNEYLLDILRGKVRYSIPEGVRILSIHNNPLALSLDIILCSEREVRGITYKLEEGKEIPLSTGIQLRTIE